MSRATVRAAVVAWFAPPNVTSLRTVYTAPPKTSKEAEAFASAAPGTESGAVGWPYLGTQYERRIAFGGPTSGKKMRYTKVSFHMVFRSTQRKAEDAQADHDAMLDSFLARLQAGRTLNGSVFQAGEGDTVGGQDVEVLVDLPKVANGGMVYIWSRVDFIVAEILTT